MSEEMVQVSKAELDALRHIRAITDKAWKDKEHGATFRKALKSVEPSLNIPDEIGDTITAPLKAEIDQVKGDYTKLLERIDAKDKAEKDASDERGLRDELARVRKEFNFDDEGMAKVIARMKEKNSLDVEGAAAAVARSIPKPQVIKEPGFAPAFADTKTVFGAVDDSEDKIKLLHSGDPFKFFDAVVAEELNKPVEQAAA